MPMWDAIRQGEISQIWRMPDGSLSRSIRPAPLGILPGSFDPLHQGHRELRDVAERRLGGPVHYELTIANADKPPLESDTIGARLSQFDADPVWITSAPTFARKAELLPGVTFVVGADTAERIVHPRFYDASLRMMHEALESIRNAGCRFLVAGRFYSGEFRTKRELILPKSFEDLFEMLPEADFRRDISSTDLRSERTEKPDS
jgi:nicotinic acid mononucleotide adenylyltransferase